MRTRFFRQLMLRYQLALDGDQSLLQMIESVARPLGQVCTGQRHLVGDDVKQLLGVL